MQIKFIKNYIIQQMCIIPIDNRYKLKNKVYKIPINSYIYLQYHF